MQSARARRRRRDKLFDIGAERQLNSTDATLDSNSRTTWGGLDSDIAEFEFAD
jgi:hypothetical protein